MVGTPHPDSRVSLKILHVIYGLQSGGAETMLCRILENTPPGVWESKVLTLEGPGPLDGRVLQTGTPLASMNLKAGHSAMSSFRALKATFGDQWRPDIIQGWMYHGNLAAWMLSLLYPQAVLAWNIHQSLHDLSLEKPSTIRVLKCNAALSKSPTTIISCSRLSIGQHRAYGFHGQSWHLIPNGCDLRVFKKDGVARKRLRQTLGIPEDAFLVGQVARVHPVKDHSNTMQAIAMLIKVIPGLRLVFVGQGASSDNIEFVALLQGQGIMGITSLLGEVEDVSSIFPAIDCLVNPSISEAFPNVIGEALACEVPCVVTQVGDSEWALGGHGILIPPRSPAALSEGIRKVFEMGPEWRAKMGADGRAYMEKGFSIRSVVDSYRDCYRDIAGKTF